MALTIGTGITIGGGITLQAILPPAPWTWDPGYLGTPGLVLSNGNLVVTAISTQDGNEPSVLGTYPIPANSKVMFSVCALAVTTTDVSGVGVGSHDMTINNFIGANFTTSQGVYEDGGNYTQTQTPSNTGLTYDSLNTIDVAIDRVNGLFWYRTGAPGDMSNWNNSSADPATATGGYPISDLVGTVYPAVSPYYNADQPVPPAFSMAGSFGANSDPGGAVPAGFTFIAATAPAWYWNSYPSGPMSTAFSGRTVYDNQPGAFSALGSYAVGDTARVVYSVQLSYDLDDSLAQNQAVGFGLNSTTLTDALGTTDKSMAVLNSGEVYWNNTQVYSGLPTFAVGDIIDVALTGTYVTPGWWYRVNGGNWNGDPDADPTTNTGGLTQYVDDTSSPIYPAVSIAGQFGPSVFTIQDVPVYPVPTGFTFLGTSQVAPPPPPVLSLDAGNPASYPGSGTTWTDLISSRTFNLINGPTYNSANGGYLNFDTASGQFALCSVSLPSLTTWTVEAWHYYTGTNSSGSPCIVAEAYAGGPINYAVGNCTDSSPNLQSGYWDGSSFHPTPIGTILTPGNWYQVVGTYDGTANRLYLNGAFVSSTASTSVPSSSNAGIFLMHRWDSDQVWGGRLGIVRIYDTALVAGQVEQNFNTNRARFGL